ncbi:terminase family protein [Treponema zuelzerae]|uniref:Terminase family protein n=1 Tax=Teretinema zuelzerae TaxID=156 RepID=A0AAE3EGV9_9SPIR|nr:terminase family protein [Teretinema zuelzerae]
MVNLSVKRFLSDLERSKESDYPYYFDERRADKMIAFLELLKQFEGEFNNKFLVLSDWQCFIIANIVGWRLKIDPTSRRFLRAFIMVARKNGKSFLFSGFALENLLTEPGAQVCSFATTREQAQIILRNLKQIIAKNSDLEELLTVYRAEIQNKGSAGRFFCLSKESKFQDGMSISYGLADEVAAMRDSYLVDVVQSSMGSRRNPALVQITTAGYNFESPGYQEYEKSRKILTGALEDERFFTIIYQYDKEDRWDDPTCFIKANPNLNVSVKESFLLSQLQDAKNSGSKRAEFMTKHCNIFLKSFDSWITPEVLKKAEPDEVSKALDLTEYPCFGAIDLSIKNDFTAYTLCWFIPVLRRFILRHKFYIPDATVTQRFASDSKHIFDWIEKGFIKPCDGEMIDMENLYEDINDDLEKYNLRAIGVDPYRAQEISALYPDLVHKFSQSHLNMSGPISLFEREISRGNITDLDNNPVFKWMMSNAQCKTLPKNLLKLTKVNEDKTSGSRIDGVITSVMAVSLAAGNMPEETSAKTIINFDSLMF